MGNETAQEAAAYQMGKGWRQASQSDGHGQNDFAVEPMASPLLPTPLARSAAGFNDASGRDAQENVAEAPEIPKRRSADAFAVLPAFGRQTGAVETAAK